MTSGMQLPDFKTGKIRKSRKSQEDCGEDSAATSGVDTDGEANGASDSEGASVKKAMKPKKKKRSGSSKVAGGEERKAAVPRKRKQSMAAGSSSMCAADGTPEDGVWVSDANCEKMKHLLCETMETAFAGMFPRFGEPRVKPEDGSRFRKKQKKILITPAGEKLKKPPSAYLLWSKDERKNLANQKIPASEMLATLASLWKTKTAEEKKGYETEARRQQEVYDKIKVTCTEEFRAESSRRSRGSKDGSSGKKRSKPSPEAFSDSEGHCAPVVVA